MPASQSAIKLPLVRGLTVLSVAALLLAGCATAAPKPQLKPLSLTIGALLPKTGSLATLAPAEAAGVNLAVADINQAALGITIKVTVADSGDAATDTASKSVTSLISKNVSAIIGASSNDVSKKILGQVTNAGIVMVSPKNGSPEFSTAKDNGLYFRTSPSDSVVGASLGRLIARDGHARLALIILSDDYGTGIQTPIIRAFTKAGGEVVSSQEFAASATDLATRVAAVVKSKPDAVAILAQTQTAAIIAGLVAGGIPASHLYLTDRNLLQYGSSIPIPLTGAQGVAAGPILDPFFTKKLLAIDPTLTAFASAPESYDAVVLVALAALQAHSTDGKKIAAHLRAVSGGTGHGEKATDFASAAQIILAGDPVDFNGFSGGIAFDARGDPTQAVIGVFRYRADNQFVREK